MAHRCPRRTGPAAGGDRRRAGTRAARSPGWACRSSTGTWPEWRPRWRRRPVGSTSHCTTPSRRGACSPCWRYRSRPRRCTSVSERLWRCTPGGRTSSPSGGRPSTCRWPRRSWATSRSSGRRRPSRGSATRIGPGSSTTGAGRPTGGIRRRRSGSTSMRSGSRSPRSSGRRDDIAHLAAALERHRGRHVGTGGGVVSYLGPVELWLGVGAAALDDWEAADRDLTTAARLAHEAGARASSSTPTSSALRRCSAARGRRPVDGPGLARGITAGRRTTRDARVRRADRRRPRRLQR